VDVGTIQCNNPEVKKLELEKENVPSHCWLHCWEEAIGTLETIWKENGFLKVRIGKIIVILPLGLEETLEPLLGHRIAILRTDIPGKDYLFRVIPEREKTAPMTAQSLCRDEQIPIQSEVM